MARELPRNNRVQMDATWELQVLRIIDRHEADARCGARTRIGGHCRARGSGAGGRCRLHGGASTGPRTADGRERCRQAVLRRWHGSN